MRDWVALERDAAAELGGTRIKRAPYESAPDFVVRDFALVGDSKLRPSFSHHRLLREVREKYCKRSETPLLVTRCHNKNGAVAVLPLTALAGILAEVRELRRRVRDLEGGA